MAAKKPNPPKPEPKKSVGKPVGKYPKDKPVEKKYPAKKQEEALTMDEQYYPKEPRTWAPAQNLYELVNPNRPKPRQMPKQKGTPNKNVR
jgi:hypothetical protein